MLNDHTYLVEKLKKFVATNPWLPVILEIWVLADWKYIPASIL